MATVTAHDREGGVRVLTLAHPPANAIGEALLADLAAGLNAAEVERVARLMSRAGLPTEPPDLGEARYLELMGHDKKVEDGKLRLVLLKALGKAFVTSDFRPGDLRQVLAGLLGAQVLHGLVDAARHRPQVAHELAHLLYGHGSSLCYIPFKFSEPLKGQEKKANIFAIELLLPESGVVQDFEKRNLSITPSEIELGQMASKWGVSVQALGYRLENLGKIERGLTDEIVESKPTQFRRPKTPTWERQLGKRFVETSIEAYQKGLISSGKLAHALRVPIRKALEIAEQQGI